MMMILFLFLMVILVLYLLFGRFYAFGMAEYAMFNNTEPSIENRMTKPESCLQSVKNEWAEFVEAVMEMQLMNAFLEFCDVLHTITKYISVHYLPKSLYCSTFYWSFIFFFHLPVSIKMANRYRNYNCIRNHKNANNCHHTCNYIYYA